MGGAFSTILGPEGLGLSGKTNKQTQQTQLDPTTRALNQYRLNALQNSGLDSGSWMRPSGNEYTPSDTTQNIINGMIYAGSASPLNAQDWYNRTLQGIDPQNERNYLGGLQSQNIGQLGQARNDYLNAGAGNLQNTLNSQLGYGQNQLYGNLQNSLSGQGQELANVLNNQLQYGQNQLGGNLNNQLAYGTKSLDSTYNAQMNQLQGLGNSMLGAGNQYFNQILGPQLQNQNSLLGLGRSGADLEAQAKGAASVAMPIEQTLAGLQGNVMNQYAGNLAGLNQAAYGQYGQGSQNLMNSAFGQYGSGIQNAMNQAYGQYGTGTQNLMNQAFGQYGSGLQNLVNNAYGNYNNQLGSQLQQGYGANQQLGQQNLQNTFGLNSMYPSTYSGLQDSYLNRLGQAFGASDYARQLQQQGFEGTRGASLSMFNSTPYFPATTMKTSGTGNEGLLDTAFGAGMGQGAGMAVGMM